MSEPLQSKPVRRTPLIRQAGIYVVLLIAGFLFGYIPMWAKGRECRNNFATSERQLALARLQTLLSSAVIDARRADYEPARQAASQFFSSLRAELDHEDASTLTQAQRAGVQPLLTPRDEIITLLARSDPAAADRLAELYVSYRKIMSS